MAGVAGLPLAAVVSILLSSFTIVVFGVVMIVCIASPIIALVSAALDSQHRAFHDRIARVSRCRPNNDGAQSVPVPNADPPIGSLDRSDST